MIPCPECGERVDREMAVPRDGEQVLMCWNGHRFPIVADLVTPPLSGRSPDRAASAVAVAVATSA